MDNSLRAKLEEISHGEVVFDCPLAPYTSFAIGGPADALLVIKRKEDLAHLLNFFHNESLRWRVFGKGSNLLVNDAGFRGVVLQLAGEFAQIAEASVVGENRLTVGVGAGCSLTKLNHHCCRQGLGGMVFSYGIPGTVGGALLMNAGAWGKQMADLVVDVGLITAKGYEKLAVKPGDFRYRSWSSFAAYIGRGIIVDVTLALTSAHPSQLQGEAKELLRKRKVLQPHNYPNAGSVFKNPQGDSAGRLIDECGLKGESVGGAMVSTKHGNFIINNNKATATDVLTLIARVQHGVKKRFCVDLELEIHVLGASG